TGQALPLVIAMHGYTQGAVELEAMTQLDAAAAKEAFAVIYPQGIGSSWNAGSCCGVAQSQRIDDVEFMRQVIDKLVSEGDVDPKRVFATGFSNGGMMAHRLAGDLADKLAAVASVSGSLVTPCRPSRPVSALEIHGIDD